MAREVKLSDGWLNARLGKEHAEREVVRDSTCKGLRVRLGKSGSITFIRYSFTKGAGHTFEKLGRFPDLSLAQARSAFARRTGQSWKREGEGTLSANTTVAEATPQFIAYLRQLRRTPRDERTSSVRRARGYFEKKVIPVLGTRKVGDVAPPDVAGVVRSLVQTGKTPTATTVHRLLTQFFAWLEANGAIERSPAAVLKPTALGAQQRPPRKRFLSEKEIVAFWKATETDSGARAKPVTLIGLRLLLLTAVRSGELRTARWSDVDFDKAEWRIPPESRKLKKAAEAVAGDFLVPLSPQVVALFRELQDLAQGNEYVLAIRREGIDTHLKESTLAAAVKDLFGKRSRKGAPVLTGMPDFTPHDLRRTARSYFRAKLHGDFEVVERCLGHAVGRIVETYDQGDYLPQRRALLDKWAAFVDGLVNPGGATVTRLPTARSG